VDYAKVIKLRVYLNTHIAQNDCQLCIYQDDSNTYYAVGLAMGIHVI